jgi:DNA-binding CsgD family transcriptional regulator
MNAREMVARLDELNQQLCGAYGVPRSADAANLDEAITMSATTTDRLVAGERAIGDCPGLVEFLAAQVQAREMRAGGRACVVRALTEGIRRMKKAGSLQGLGRQACTELCDALGFEHALLSLVVDDGFVVEESGHGVCGLTVISRRECIAERDCIRLRETIRTNESDVPTAPGYRQLLCCGQYLVAPVIAESRVVALLHVSHGSDGVSVRDIDALDAFASAYSLLHERMLNTERVAQQRTSIARAAAGLTEEADRIAAAAIGLDVEYNHRVEPPTIAPDSALAATLSDRERQIFERLVLGASNAEIADELVITVETTKTHVKRILRKIGAINRCEAIALYTQARTASLRYADHGGKSLAYAMSNSYDT